MNENNKIDLLTLEKLSKLARLDFKSKSAEKLIEDLNQIIGFIDQLNEVSTEKVEPLSSVTGHKLPLRKDIVTDGKINKEVLENAPEKTSDYFVVPKVIE